MQVTRLCSQATCLVVGWTLQRNAQRGSKVTRRFDMRRYQSG